MSGALERRLRAVADVLLGADALPDATEPALLRALLAEFDDARPDVAWLVYVGIAGAFPGADQLDALRRAVRLADDAALVEDALAAVDVEDLRHHADARELEIVQDRPVVDVGFCATHEHNTGIQRVVRAVMPRWQEQGRPFHLVAWTDDDAGFRELSDRERHRVLNWADGPALAATVSSDALVVPWHVPVFLPEVAAYDQCAPLACLGESGAAPLSMIGYDVIPVTSADSVGSAESERFASYLTVVKHATRVAAISDTVAEEFSGFAAALPAQGLTGPEVLSVPLAIELPHGAVAAGADAGAGRDDAALPVVACVGSHEPRKNQEAVLFAAERLLREGQRFRMVFVGGGSRIAYARFDRRVRRLRKEGRTVETHRSMSDAELWPLLAGSRFTVFVSKHEGFGLPAAESLAQGVPVLTSDYGSLAEIASSGGCVLVDPRDDEAILDGMRRLLSDDDLVARLRGEARAAHWRTWDEYADALWTAAGLDDGGAA